MVTFGGIPFDDPAYRQPVTTPQNGPDVDWEPEPAPRKSTAKKGKKDDSDGLTVDAPTAASMVLLTANGAALQIAGSRAAMTEAQYDGMHRPLTYIIGHTTGGQAVEKYAAPLALLVAALSWLQQVGTAYRETHPAKPKTRVVTPQPESRASATVTEQVGDVTPHIHENGMAEADLAAIAASMGV